MGKAPACYGLATDQGLPPLAEAASLLLAILRAARVDSLADLTVHDEGAPAIVVPWDIALTDHQRDLLREHQQVLALMRRSVPQTKDPATKQVTAPGIKPVTLAVCDECDGWLLISTPSAPASCTMTFGCAGKPVKASAAAKTAAPGVQSDRDRAVSNTSIEQSQTAVSSDAGAETGLDPADLVDFD